VDPYDVDGLTNAIIALASDAALRKNLSARGLKRASEFSWTRTAKEMLALYARVAGAPIPRSVRAQKAGALS
jgi:glycosyltransferase involved in cell wall biosynthesis